MKLFINIFVAVALHPIAMVLVWLDLARRTDLSDRAKWTWGIIGFVWGIGPLLYISLADGKFW
jgi:hypothetical protein